MKKITDAILISSLALLVAAIPACSKLEIQVKASKKSPDDKWTAVVQLEVVSAPAFVNDAVFAVRLKGPAQKDRLGDLVMNVQAGYPDPPSIDWSGDTLIVTLNGHQKHQYLAASPVNGVPIELHEN